MSFPQVEDHDGVSTQTHDDGGGQPQDPQSRERPEQQAGEEYAEPGGLPIAHRPGPRDISGDDAFTERWETFKNRLFWKSQTNLKHV